MADTKIRLDGVKEETERLKLRIEALEAVLVTRPAKEGIADDRYWKWDAKVREALAAK